MNDSNCTTTQQPVEGAPRVAPPLTAPVQPTLEDSAGLGAVVAEAFGVAHDAIAAPVAPVFGGDAFHQLAAFAVSVRPNPFGQPRHRAAQFFADAAARRV